MTQPVQTGYNNFVIIGEEDGYEGDCHCRTSTAAMEVKNLGCVLRSTSYFKFFAGDEPKVSESLQWIPGARLKPRDDHTGWYYLAPLETTVDPNAALIEASERLVNAVDAFTENLIREDKDLTDSRFLESTISRRVEVIVKGALLIMNADLERLDPLPQQVTLLCEQPHYKGTLTDVLDIHRVFADELIQRPAETRLSFLESLSATVRSEEERIEIMARVLELVAPDGLINPTKGLAAFDLWAALGGEPKSIDQFSILVNYLPTTTCRK